MPEALFLRHGQYLQPEGVPSAHLPYSLTPNGEDQVRSSALHVARHIQERGIDVHKTIWTSHLPRAQQSATLLAKELERELKVKLEVRESSELAERCLGSFANLQIEQIEEILVRDYRWDRPAPGWKRDADFRLPGPGAESLSEAGGRVLRFVEAHISAEQSHLFVGHGGAFRHCAVRMGVLDTEQAKRLSMHHGGFVAFEKNDTWRQSGGAFKMRNTTEVD